MTDYSDYITQPGDNLLKALSTLAQEQQQAEAEVARLEEELKKAQKTLQDISEHKIPELMEEAGMEEFTTSEGLKISIKEKIRGSIPKATEAQALNWLEQNGHDRLIKREFTIQFGKDEEKWANKFQADLNKRKRKLNTKIKRAVHSSTLCSFVEQQLEDGVDFPMELFGVYRQRNSKISFKKE